MKKILCYLLIIFTLFSFSGCTTKDKKAETSEKASEDQFDIKVANNLIDVYMKYLMAEDKENLKKLYTEELTKSSKDMGENELKVTGYNIEEANEVGSKGVFKLKVSRNNPISPAAVLDECTIKVVKKEAEYKISEISSEIEKEAFIENNNLRLRTKNNVKTNLIIDNNGIPEYTFSKDDKASMYKLTVPKTNFGVMNFSYDGNTLAISTMDKDSFAGIVKIDETLAVQGNQPGGKGDEGSKNGSEAGGQQKAEGKEKPVGKEIVPIDLIKNAKIENMIFTQDQRNMLLQYLRTNGERCIRVYNSDNGEMIDAKFEDKYPLDRVEVIFSSFDKEALNYEVVQKPNAEKAPSDILGKWQLDLKEFKEKKL